MARNLSQGLTPDAEAFADLFRIVSTYGVTVPPEIEVVFKTLATLQGTLAELAPGFDIIRESQRFSDTQITAQLAPVDLKDAAIKGSARAGAVAAPAAPALRPDHCCYRARPAVR